MESPSSSSTAATPPCAYWVADDASSALVSTATDIPTLAAWIAADRPATPLPSTSTSKVGPSKVGTSKVGTSNSGTSGIEVSLRREIA